MKKPKILIVEDEAIIAIELKMMLEHNGYEVFPVVSTASDAVRKSQQLHPEIILMDVILKGPETGIDAACQIQNIKNIPIIFLTGNRQFIDEDRLKKLHNYKILSKPSSQFELIEEIIRLTQS